MNHSLGRADMKKNEDEKKLRRTKIHTFLEAEYYLN